MPGFFNGLVLLGFWCTSCQVSANPHPQMRAQGSKQSPLCFTERFVPGAQVLCTVLLIKPGVWSRRLPRILRNLHLEKFSVVGMKHLELEAAAASALLPPEVQQVGDGSSVFPLERGKG